MQFKRLMACAIGASVLITAPALAADNVPGVTKDTIKIGIFGPMTGPAALFGKSVPGIESIYKQANDEGGINGRKIELVREDTGCDPSKGVAAVKKLISQEDVFAINGGACSGVVMAVKPLIEQSGVPYVVMSAASAAISKDTIPNLFHPVATTLTVAHTMVDFAMSKPGMEKIAVVSSSDDWGKSNRDPVVGYLDSKYHMKPVADLTMDRGSSDATPQILKIRNSGAQAVMMLLYPAEAAVFVRDAYKYGLSIPVIAPQSISLTDIASHAGKQAVKNLYVFYAYNKPFSSDEMQNWKKLIEKYYPGEKVENFSYLGMGSAIATVKALKEAGPDLTRQKFIDAMDNIKDLDTHLNSAPISFSKTDHAGIKGGAMATLKDDQTVVLKSWPAN